jgi:cell division protein FtsI (penicillin-binding protein 3)
MSRRAIPVSRVLLVLLAGLLWAGLLASRLGEIQVLRAPGLREVAARQQHQSVTLTPKRGLILDRRGRELAVSVEVPSVYADPSEVRDKTDAARRLAPVLAVPAAEIRRRLERDGYFVWLKRQASPETWEAVRALGIRGVSFVPESRRAYPKRETAAHVLGHVGVDNQGLAGLEYRFDKEIGGSPGRMITLRDARGGTFLPEGLVRQDPEEGMGLRLTLDEVVQYITDRELARAMEATRAAGAAAVVLDPRTGALLSSTSLPNFDPNLHTSFPPAHFRNRALGHALEPGSCLKFVTAAAALEAGLFRPSDVVDCGRGSVRVGNTVVEDHEAYDRLSFEDVIVHSSNVGAIRIGQRVWARRLHALLTDFGFGRPTGIELPGENPGLLRPVEKWSELSLASLSMGQEVSVTPLQLAAALGAVANGGTLYRPRVVEAVLDTDGGAVREFPPDPVRRILSEDTARTLRGILRQVVERGTGKRAKPDGYTAAGKTGTAQQIGPSGTYEPGRTAAWFAGFAPADDPRIVVVVVLEQPQGTWGGVVAAPVFRAIAQEVLRYLRVPPERPSGRIVLRREGDRGAPPGTGARI